MTPTQTQIRPTVELDDLQRTGNRISQNSAEDDYHGTKPYIALSSSYDAELGTATAVPFRAVESKTKVPLRVRLRAITSRKLARRTFTAHDPIWSTQCCLSRD